MASRSIDQLEAHAKALREEGLSAAAVHLDLTNSESIQKCADTVGAVDILDEDTTLGEVGFASRPTLRFHGSIPAFVEQMRTLMQQETRMLLVAPNQGEVERLAHLLREYELPYRLGSRIQHAGSDHLADDATAVVVRW